MEKDNILKFVPLSQKTDNNENFVICPRHFFEKLSEEELSSVKQLYQVAYDRALFQTQSKSKKKTKDSVKTQNFLGDGI